MINLDKKNLPRHLYKLNVALVIFFVGWFVISTPIMITVGCLYGEKPINYIVMGVVFALYFIGPIIFIIIDYTLHKRFILQRTAELEEEFRDMLFEDAARTLEERGVITDRGFVVEGEGFLKKQVVPFEEVLLSLDYLGLVSRVNIDIDVYWSNGDYAGNLQLDRAMYNFFKDKDLRIKDYKAFLLLVNNKRKFAEFALRQAKIFILNSNAYRTHF